MKKTLLEEIQRIHSITYGQKILSEQGFLDKISQGLGFKKEDDPKKADLVSPDINQFFDTLNDAANSGGLSEQKAGSMIYQRAVESMQIGLMLLGYDLPQYGVDGLFGPETATAINRFKESNNIVSDNTAATPETLKILIKQLQGRGVNPQDIKPYVDQTITNIPLNTTGKEVMDFFIQKGLTPEQASGIVGNLYKESRLNPKAVGDNGTSYGIAQWHAERFDALKAGVTNWDTLEGQLTFLWNELNTTEKAALDNLKRTTTAQDAAVVFARDFERPSSRNYGQRANISQNLLINYVQNTT